MAPRHVFTALLLASCATLAIAGQAPQHQHQHGHEHKDHHKDTAEPRLPKVAELAYAQNGYQLPKNIYPNAIPAQAKAKATPQQTAAALALRRQHALRQRQAAVQRQALLRRQAILRRQAAIRRQIALRRQAALRRAQAARLAQARRQRAFANAKAVPKVPVVPAKKLPVPPVKKVPIVVVVPPVVVKAQAPAVAPNAADQGAMAPAPAAASAPAQAGYVTDEDAAQWDLKCADPLDLCATNTPDPGTVQLSVEQQRAPVMQAQQYYLNGLFSVDLKLPAGNSGGVNWAFYMMAPGDNKFDVQTANQDPAHNEIDIIFYGNGTGDTISLNLNVFANNKHNLAEFTLPFDPSADFHTYAIKWSPTQIVFLLDGAPFHSVNKVDGDPWPTKAMYAMASGWATPWTPLQADYTNGPIKGWMRNYQMQGCSVDAGTEQGDGVQCKGTWNDALTPGQQTALQGARNAHLVNDHGWDNA